MSTTENIRPSAFRYGDILPSGDIVVDTRFATEGVAVIVRRPDGTEREVRYNGRRKYEVIRP